MKNRFLVGAITYFISIIALLFAQLLLFPLTREISPYVSMAIIQVANFLIVKGVFKKTENKIEWQKPKAVSVLLSVVITVVVFFGFYLLVDYFGEFLRNSGVQSAGIDVSGINIIWAILVTVILAPIGEELVFRYALAGGIATRSKVGAVLVSAFAFALMHLSLNQFLYQFVLGAVLAIVMIKTGNVLYCMIIHGANNLLAICLSSVITLPPFSMLYLAIGIIAFILAGVCIYFLIRALKSDAEILKAEKNAGDLVAIIMIGIMVALCITLIVLVTF